jgi:hypothetical protein
VNPQAEETRDQIATNDFVRAVGDRVDQLGRGRCERLDAMGDAGLLGILGDRRKARLGAGKGVIPAPARIDHALPGRAVHQEHAALDRRTARSARA